ncbi:uncharacterized protein LOC127103621 [Lathyrus oleraceus]|uniref:uncharacterized protein LOC127103621 n=1 Tax=Pisum sativum TaxID=3888 RepID=UPI0021D0743A|nr:uncharacterized protein LOC127103621 [Pisum sativum]
MSLSQFLIKADVYFNGASPPIEFRLPDGTTSLAGLMSKLNELLADTKNRKVGKIEFREDWIDTDGRMKYNLIELKTCENVKDIWRSFPRRITNGSIELDAKISRSIDDIMKRMRRLESSGSAWIFLFITIF